MRERKPEVILENLLVEDFANEGVCIAKHEGKVVFVSGEVAPGDLIDLRIYKNKAQYIEGRAINIRPQSALRAVPVCEHFGLCGGCKWQHIQYNTQLAFKARLVEDSLKRIGKIEIPTPSPIIGSSEIYQYRNKLEYSYSVNRWLTDSEMSLPISEILPVAGFHVPRRYDKIIDIQTCHLQPEPTNAIRLYIKQLGIKNEWSFYDYKARKGFLRTLTIRTANTGQVMVIVQFGSDEPDAIKEVMDGLKFNFSDIFSLNYVVNLKPNDTIQDQDIICFSGKPYIEERMESLTFRVGPKSFFQTNASQALQLYQATCKLAKLSGNELVYDLYTGTGSIAQFVAKQAKKVIGLEYVEPAVEDAQANAALNGISNTEFFAGDMKKLLTTDFFDIHGKPDVVITDPPRAGMDAPVVQALLVASPQRIVYVSCNVATQARDLALLDEQYKVTSVQPVDMFPHTHHVENIVALEKRS